MPHQQDQVNKFRGKSTSCSYNLSAIAYLDFVLKQNRGDSCFRVCADMRAKSLQCQVRVVESHFVMLRKTGMAIRPLLVAKVLPL